MSPPGATTNGSGTRRIALLLAVLGALLATIAVAAGTGPPKISYVGPSAPPAASWSSSSEEPAGSPGPRCPPICPKTRSGGVLAVLAMVLCLAVAASLVLALVVMLIRSVRRHPAGRRPRRPVPDRDEPVPPAPLRTAPEEVAAALETGLADLADTDADPRRAIIACWLRLERAAEQAGTPRLVGDAPADLVGRLLASHRVDPVALEGLARSYRRARYAADAVDEEMREAAVAALRQVHLELRRPRPAAPLADAAPGDAAPSADGAAG